MKIIKIRMNDGRATLKQKMELMKKAGIDDVNEERVKDAEKKEVY